ncbi:hypothetical protein RJ640_005776 [Escallonia rubra]|uniref:Uncharacterized protein n=1 Tax=Escallonia rubra TaxID=112253 RepID=A0AA88SA01_9ASTE|nr:hypothetical protein RJ640_005776 [Escallonia rubra]
MAQAARGSDYTIRFSCHKNMRGLLHSPTLNSILEESLHRSRRFSGFAKDDNISKEKEALVNNLDKILDGKNEVLGDKRSYRVAQYNASSHLSGRLNEVWINVSGYTLWGCPSN